MVKAVIVSDAGEDARHMPQLRQRDDALAARVTAWIASAAARKASTQSACEDAGRWGLLAALPDGTMSGSMAGFAKELRADIAGREAARQ